MNESLKAVMDEAIDLENLVKAVVGKDYSGCLADVIKVGSDLPKMISSLPALMPELAVLMNNPAADADLVAYVGAKVGGESVAVQHVIVSIVDLLLGLAQIEPKALALAAAIKAAHAAPVVAAVAAEPAMSAPSA